MYFSSQFNKILISKDPKMKIKQNILELGISRSISQQGRRKTHIIARNSKKEFSQICLKSLIQLNESNKKKYLKKFEPNINSNFVFSNLSQIISSSQFLFICYAKLKFKNIDLIHQTKNLFIEKRIRLKNSSLSLNETTINASFFKNQIISEIIITILETAFTCVIFKCPFDLVETQQRHLNKQKKERNTPIFRFITGNIKKRFFIIDYSVLINFISGTIKNPFFINLMNEYFETKIKKNFFNNHFLKISINNETDHVTFLLLNIYLNKIDKWMTNEFFLKFKNQKTNLVSNNFFVNSTTFYFRYKLDFIIGFEGNKQSCFNLKYLVQNYFQKELKLLNNEYEIKTTKNEYLFNELKLGVCKTKQKILVRVSIQKVLKALNDKGFTKRDNRPTSNKKLIHYDVDQIIGYYKRIENNIRKYYSNANNFEYFRSKIHFVLKQSCALTIASKMKLRTIRKVFCKYGKNLTIKTANGKVISYP